MFELGRWREPTPIFNESGHSARKKKPVGIPNSGHTCGLFFRIRKPIDELLFTGAFSKQTRLLSRASRNNA